MQKNGPTVFVFFCLFLLCLSLKVYVKAFFYCCMSVLFSPICSIALIYPLLDLLAEDL